VVLSQHLPRRSEQNCRKLQHSRCPGLNRFQNYKIRVLLPDSTVSPNQHHGTLHATKIKYIKHSNSQFGSEARNKIALFQEPPCNADAAQGPALSPRLQYPILYFSEHGFFDFPLLISHLAKISITHAPISLI